MTIKPSPPRKRIVSLLRTGPSAIALRFIDQAYRKIRGAPLWELSQVTPRLFLGGQHSRRGWRAMQAAGVTAVVNLREARFSDAAKGIGGERHLHLPTVDNTPPTAADLMRGAAFIGDEIQRGGKVYIHCGVGVGRAPTLTAAFLMTTGLSAEEALRQIKKARPFVHLTDEQRDALDEFARRWPSGHPPPNALQ